MKQKKDIATESGTTGGSKTTDERMWLSVAAERLSFVRYVFLVHIEDGIPTAEQRSALEYADAVLIGWPDNNAPDVVDIDEQQQADVNEHVRVMEEYIDRFRQSERDNDIDEITDVLIRIAERVAEIRKQYQPDFLLPTFAEIRRVVQEEWDEDMGKIDPQPNATASEIEQETQASDEATSGKDQGGKQK